MPLGVQTYGYFMLFHEDKIHIKHLLNNASDSLLILDPALQRQVSLKSPLIMQYQSEPNGDCNIIVCDFLFDHWLI